MLEIKLSEPQMKLFKKIFKKEKSHTYYSITKNSIFIIENIEDTLNKIIEIISDFILKHGLKKNDEPNNLGYELENLNDVFIEALQNNY